MTEKPKAAFVLSLISGIIVLVVGFILMIIYHTFIFSLISGVIWGILIILGAVMLYSRPQQHKTWSIIVLVFSFLSLFSTVGGLYIGFILGLAGGIMGILWKPSQIASTSSPSSISRICPNCGTVIQTDSRTQTDTKFCPQCGKQLP